MQNIRPRTKVTKKESARIKKIAKDFFDEFSPTFLANECDVKLSVAQSNKYRLTISARCAHEFCTIKEVKEAGYTRESLRPDIKCWYGDE